MIVAAGLLVRIMVGKTQAANLAEVAPRLVLARNVRIPLVMVLMVAEVAGGRQWVLRVVAGKVARTAQ